MNDVCEQVMRDNGNDILRWSFFLWIYIKEKSNMKLVTKFLSLDTLNGRVFSYHL